MAGCAIAIVLIIAVPADSSGAVFHHSDVEVVLFLVVGVRGLCGGLNSQIHQLEFDLNYILANLSTI